MTFSRTLSRQLCHPPRLFTGIPSKRTISSSTPPPPPPPPTPQQCDESRHLLRAVLRETSYLPDPHARHYLRKHALHRFRDYSTPASSGKPTTVLAQRRDAQVRNARKALSELRRANAGELKPLTKVLHLAYGRTGKRRRQLLAPLLPTEPQPLPSLTPALHALLASQLRTHPPSTTRPTPRNLSPRIPDKNSWERPMPQKRVANMTADWYANLLDRALPPLSTTEWEKLRHRALGLVPFHGPVKKRTKVSSVWKDKDTLSLLEKTLGVNVPVTPQAILDRVDDEVRGRNLTRRFMQRRWAAVFAQCPKMDWDEQKELWVITWGSSALMDAVMQKSTSSSSAVSAINVKQSKDAP